MKEEVTHILAECLDALDRGEITIEECQRRYPQHQEELKYLLLLSKYIKAAPDVTPSPVFRHAAKTRMNNLIRNQTSLGKIQHPSQVKEPLSHKFRDRGTVRRSSIPRILVTAIIVIGLLFGGTVSTAAASSDSLPGDTLYPVKTSIEDIKLAFADDEGDVELNVQYAQNRVEEMQALVEADRYEDIPIAVQRYENNIAALAQAMAHLAANDPARAEAHANLLEAARANRTETLTGLLDKVPEQAKKGIQRALEAGPPDHAGGPPEDKGKPDRTPGPPEGKGKPTQVSDP
jgi:hypothetical protein